MIQPQLHHWVLLVCCGLVTFIEGVVSMKGGTSPEVRSYPGERIIDPVLNVGLMIFSVLILLRQSWAFYGLICCLALLFIIGSLIFLPSEAWPFVKRYGVSAVTSFWVIFLAIIYVTPIALLIWLRPIFTAK
ncbi:MAG: hypothetical protein WBW41_18005 [Verrucomicrobiia bacterium]